MGLLAKVKGKIDYLFREIVLYIYRPEKIVSQSLKEEFYYHQITEIESLKEFSFEYSIEEYQNRFSQNNIMCYYSDQKKVIAYGWINPNATHYLGELALEMDLKSKFEVLYDFHTNSEYRGKGLYPFLLKKMVLRNNKSKLIYTFSHNTSSIRGIEKAGFKILGSIKGYNKNKYLSLIK